MLNADINIHAYLRHKKAYRNISRYVAKRNSNKPKDEPVRNEKGLEREKIVGSVQRSNCTTHHQKSSRHPTAQINPDPTNVGLQDRKDR